MKPLISIIIPAYNAAAFLAFTLNGVCGQTESRWELIVVDDGSSDGTRLLAEDYARRDARIRVIAQANGGQAAARNRGFAAASPESLFVIFLDHDDVWEPDALNLLRHVLEQTPDAVAAHGMGRFINADGQPVRPGELENKVRRREALAAGGVTTWPPGQPTTFAVLIVDCCLVSPGLVLIRRQALEKAGLLDTMPALGFSALDDWDLWLRLSRQGNFAVVNEVVLNYRLHANNLSKRRREMFLGTWHVLQKTALSPDLSQEHRRLATQRYAAFIQETRREMATHLRRVAFADFSAVWKSLRRRKFSHAWAKWHAAWPRYQSYLLLRQFIAPEGVLAYTGLKDELLPERMRRAAQNSTNADSQHS